MPTATNSRFTKDNEVFFKFTSRFRQADVEPEIFMEGGAIEVNGQGLVLTTEQCLLNKNRNTGMLKETMEKNLKNFLGAKKIIWLQKGLVNDHTDGHIDELARFVAPSKILCAYEENASEENYEILNNNYQTLIKPQTIYVLLRLLNSPSPI
jgi:agmatine deiminase